MLLLSTTCRNSSMIDGSRSQMMPYSHEETSQGRILAGFPAVSSVQGEPVIDVHGNVHMINRASLLDPDFITTSLGRNLQKDGSIGSSQSTDSLEFQEQFIGRMPVPPSSSLDAFSAARNNLAMSESSSIFPLDFGISNGCGNDLNSSLLTSLSSIYAEASSQPFTSMRCAGSDGWISLNGANLDSDYPHDSSKSSSELSLSLATTEPANVSRTNISDKTSEISCSDASLDTRGGRRPVQSGQWSSLISGSRYLQGIQEILAQIATYSLVNLDYMSCAARTTNRPHNWMPLVSSDELPNLDRSFNVQMEQPASEKRVAEAKKTKLLSLLQVVDDRYTQCLDEIHTVVSAFHAATELDPQVHARFALQTISYLYKSLRERISNQIIAMGASFDNGSNRGHGKSFQNSFIQEQWAIQQLKKREHQLWRPQRGLPENSVSVLRAWMFQNFLHPYPKDAEKHLLAVKSGLTRSQVSNWFINARVRLWKPMIEEMYAEMNRRKARENAEATDFNWRN